MKTKNPLLKEIKDNDIVLFRYPFTQGEVRIMVRLYDVEYQPANEKYDFDWLESKGEPLYTNQRLSPESITAWKEGKMTNPICAAEIIKPDFVEQYSVALNMWKADENMLTEAEVEHIKLKFSSEM